MDSGQVNKLKFLICRDRDQLVNQKCHIFLCCLHFIRQKYIQAPDSGPGIQEESEQVKNLNNLNDELEMNL